MLRSPRALVLSAAACAAAALLAPAPSFAAGYGDVTGKVVLDGKAPDLEPRVEKGAAVKDAEVCADQPVPNFSLVVGEKGGIANVFLYPAMPIRDIKPELKDAPQEPVVFDQKGCVFKPHAVIVRTGQPLELYNSDPVAHNVRFTSFGNPGINVTVPAGAAPGGGKGVEVEFNRAQRVPIPALCDFHPWMKANWLIVDHPYAALTDAEGNFTIEGLPAGKHRFTVWHESAGFLDQALTVEVKADGTTELGELKYKLAAFKNLK
ncbi:carboxypeptidase regulatory-like domain-containing protein [Alienimonas californiensis]|uniref:Rhamnogalacturonan lyase domain-containing protein n=1 Tax=Alienimonas californiensis TaxID=2527989 RepID=A0A517P543_9PLAN|nr:carboxypeptidase regulatory-like domain-containing protein [Alienimonas californiensis]QDT14500.1 hypothetical protein CA12_05740 [Alienimonas californiensis]